MSGASKAVAGVTALIAAGALVAGCGGDAEESNDYVDAVNGAQIEIVGEITQAASEIPAANSNNPEAAVEGAEAMAAVFGDGAETIAAIDPPEDVADLHDELVALLEDVETQIDDAAQLLSSDDPAELQEGATAITAAGAESQTEFDRIITEINAQLQN